MLEMLNSCLHMFSHLYVLTEQTNQPVSFLLPKRIYACVSEAWLNLCLKSESTICDCHTLLAHAPPPPPRRDFTCVLGGQQTLEFIHPRSCKPCHIATHHGPQLMGCYHMLPIAKCTPLISFQMHYDPYALQHPTQHLPTLVESVKLALSL